MGADNEVRERMAKIADPFYDAHHVSAPPGAPGASEARPCDYPAGLSDRSTSKPMDIVPSPRPATIPDDLASYINRLTRTRLLTASEEKTLTRRARVGDLAAKERLIESNMRLVVSIAKNYLLSGIPLEDLIQEGAIGLMTATERFNPSMGYRFSTYATQWVRQSIGRAIDNKAKAIRLPAHISESLRKIDKARLELQRMLGTDPTDEQLAAHCGMTIKKITSLMQTTQDPISLDMTVGDDTTSLGALVLDRNASDPQEELIAQEMKGEIETILSTLDEREQMVLRRRFGFDEDDQSVLQQIGDELNISASVFVR